MGNSIFSSAVAPSSLSIKQVMRLIDHSGLRVAYIVKDEGKLLGAVSDSDIRKAILRGTSIQAPVKDIVNPHPIVLREEEVRNSGTACRKVGELLQRMPDSRYVLVVDAQERPTRLMRCAQLLENKRISRTKHSHARKSVLVVGGAGFLGSVLVRKLLARGFKVRVLDILMFGTQSIETLKRRQNFSLIEGDMRDISTVMRALNGIDAVINLAAIVGDPACKTRPETTIETNYLANKLLAEAARFYQVNRFIYASTCSVYGMMEGRKKLTEEAPLNPVSLYARSKIDSEAGILSLMDENFSPTILRMGTLYGYSPRMRFDLVVNTMTKTAVMDRKISVHGGGKQWRPLLHVEDAAEAYIKCLTAPLEHVRGQTFNVGSERQNYQIIEIAGLVKKCIPEVRLLVENGGDDPRNYIVSFSRIEKKLNFRAAQGVVSSVLAIKKAIEDKSIADVNDPKYYNVEHVQ